MLKEIAKLLANVAALVLVCEGCYRGEWKHDFSHATYCLVFALVLRNS